MCGPSQVCRLMAMVTLAFTSWGDFDQSDPPSPVEGGAPHVPQPEEVVELDQVRPVSRVPAAHHQEEVFEGRARPQPRQLEGLVTVATPSTPEFARKSNESSYRKGKSEVWE
jgi:hypothetical protein